MAGRYYANDFLTLDSKPYIFRGFRLIIIQSNFYFSAPEIVIAQKILVFETKPRQDDQFAKFEVKFFLLELWW